MRYRFTDTATWTVPTALMRQGNFSELLTSIRRTFWARWSNLKTPPPAIPIPGNIIPASQLSPNGLGILKAYPDPNLRSATIIGNQQLLHHRAAPAGSAQRHACRRYESHRQAAPAVPPQQLLVLRISTARWHADAKRPSFSTGPTRPIRSTMSGPSARTGERSSSPRSAWTMSTFRSTRPTSSTAPRSGINYPYIFPQGKLIPTRIPTANITGLNGLTAVRIRRTPLARSTRLRTA